MLGADLLLVEEYGAIMPSKTLQYIWAGRPILALVERGGLIREVLDGMPHAHLIGQGESARAGRLIAELALSPRVPGPVPAPAAVATYSRREIARRFAAVLDAATGRRGPRGSGERIATAPA
jgi:hypothetical protein